MTPEGGCVQLVEPSGGITRGAWSGGLKPWPDRTTTIKRLKHEPVPLRRSSLSESAVLEEARTGATILKLSRYNWLVDYRDSLLLFNGFTGALCRAEPDKEELLRDALGSTRGLERRLGEIDEQTLALLRKCGLLIEESFDERKALRVLFNINRFSPRTYVATVVVTYRCNFACEYCFEHDFEGEGLDISPDVIDRVAELTGEADLKTFNLYLFGGEPLLLVNECLELTSKCRDAALGSGKEFNAVLITNGYLLTEDVAQSLAESGVTKAQITIDGGRELHDSKRPLADGSPTFDQVCRNARAASRHMKVTIRSNISREEGFDPKELLKEFAGCPVTLHAAPTCRSHEGDFQSFRDNMEYIYANLPLGELGARRPMRFQQPCGACALWTYGGSVVTPDGTTIRCWSEVGDSSVSYGNIFEPSMPRFFEPSIPWLAWDPYFPGTPCFECRMLPSCGGGCQYWYLKNGKTKCFFTEQTYQECIVGRFVEAEELRKENQKGGEESGYHHRADVSR